MCLRRECFCYVLLCFCSIAKDIANDFRDVKGNGNLVSRCSEFNGAYLHHAYNHVTDVMELTCDEKATNCTIIVEVVQPPPRNISFTCEVSGEGPMFRLANKTIVIKTDVPPSDAVIEVLNANDSNLETNGSGKVLLNCSSTGVPAPRITWTVGDENSEISSFHSSRVWNATSKLWYSWSTVMAPDQLPIRCTPKVSRGSNTYLGKTAEYSAASRIELLGLTHIILAISLTFIS